MIEQRNPVPVSVLRDPSGRGHSQVEFGRLPGGQAASLLGRPVDRAMTLAEVMTAAPVESRLEPMAVGQYL